MFDLCNFFEILHSHEADLEQGFIVEKCSDFDAMLGDLVVYCTTTKVPEVKQWIQDNLRSNAENCLQNFNLDPAMALSLVCVFKGAESGITSYTESFVLDAGGVQGLYDKYCVKEVVKEPLVLDNFSTEDSSDYDVTMYYSDYQEESKPVIQPDGNYALVDSTKLDKLFDFVEEIHAEKLKNVIPVDELLCEEDKSSLLEYLDKYPVSISKEFIKEFIRTTQTDDEYVLLTKVMNRYAQFVKEKLGE